MRRALLGLVVLLVASSVEARQAEAEFRICNTTTFRINTAFGWKDDRYGWVSQGWWAIEAGACRAIITGRLTQRHYYVYGQGTGDHRDIFYKGRTPFCIKNEKFKLYQSQFGNNKQADCTEAGLYSARFQDADTQGAANHTFRLTYSGAPQARGPGFVPPQYVSPIPGPGYQPGPALQRPPVVAQPSSGGGGGSGGTACQRFPNLC